MRFLSAGDDIAAYLGPKIEGGQPPDKDKKGAPKCPACKKPVRKIISTFTSPMKLKPVSISDAKKAGFTVLKKSSKGEYERQ